MLSSRDTSVVWDSVVAALGRQDPRAATGLVDRLAADTSLTPEDRARRLYEERVSPSVKARDQYFRQELVQMLAEGDQSLLE